MFELRNEIPNRGWYIRNLKFPEGSMLSGQPGQTQHLLRLYPRYGAYLEKRTVFNTRARQSEQPALWATFVLALSNP
jgi:hypothetical protein